MPFKNCEFDSAGRPLLKVKSSDGRHFVLNERISFVAKDGTEYVARADWLFIRTEAGLLVRANLTKPQADALCLEIMDALGESCLIREDIYEGVVLGGAHAFSDDRKAALAENLSMQPSVAT